MCVNCCIVCHPSPLWLLLLHLFGTAHALLACQAAQKLRLFLEYLFISRIHRFSHTKSARVYIIAHTNTHTGTHTCTRIHISALMNIFMHERKYIDGCIDEKNVKRFAALQKLTYPSFHLATPPSSQSYALLLCTFFRYAFCLVVCLIVLCCAHIFILMAFQGYVHLVCRVDNAAALAPYRHLLLLLLPSMDNGALGA